MPFGSSALGVIHASALACLPCLWVFPAVRRRQFDALQRLDRCAVDQDWLGRILAGSIWVYALGLLAQSLAPRFGYSSSLRSCWRQPRVLRSNRRDGTA
jgi:hypothetical protein